MGNKEKQISMDRLVGIPISENSDYYKLGLVLPYFIEPKPYIGEKEQEKITEKTLQKARYLEVHQGLSPEHARNSAIEHSKMIVEDLKLERYLEKQKAGDLIENHLPGLYLEVLGVDELEQEEIGDWNIDPSLAFKCYSGFIKEKSGFISGTSESPYVFHHTRNLSSKVKKGRDLNKILSNIIKNKENMFKKLDKFLFHSVFKYYGLDSRNYDEIIRDALENCEKL